MCLFFSFSLLSLSLTLSLSLSHSLSLSTSISFRPLTIDSLELSSRSHLIVDVSVACKRSIDISFHSHLQMYLPARAANKITEVSFYRRELNWIRLTLFFGFRLTRLIQRALMEKRAPILNRFQYCVPPHVKGNRSRLANCNHTFMVYVLEWLSAAVQAIKSLESSPKCSTNGIIAQK